MKGAAPAVTGCRQESFEFAPAFQREIVVRFDAAPVSSDGGALLLREADRRMRLLSRLAQWFTDAQEGRFFHGHHCHLPLHVLCGDHLLCARLRTADQDASAGAVDEVERLVGQVRQHWPEVRITLRGDSGFCREALMGWCGAHGVDCCLGLARNARLEALLADALAEVRQRHEATGEPARLFRELRYQTRETWGRERRVIGKAEHLAKGANPRFVVTSLSEEAWPAQRLYEELYCARGEMESRIKEQFELFADRLSTHWLWSNQLRLFLSAFACVLVDGLRRLGLRGTALAQAEAQTIRTRLLKIGAVIRVSVRRVWVSLSRAHPAQAAFAQAWRALRCAAEPGARGARPRPRAALGQSGQQGEPRSTAEVCPEKRPAARPTVRQRSCCAWPTGFPPLVRNPG